MTLSVLLTQGRGGVFDVTRDSSQWEVVAMAEGRESRAGSVGSDTSDWSALDRVNGSTFHSSDAYSSISSAFASEKAARVRVASGDYGGNSSGGGGARDYGSSKAFDSFKLGDVGVSAGGGEGAAAGGGVDQVDIVHAAGADGVDTDSMGGDSVEDEMEAAVARAREVVPEGGRGVDEEVTPKVVMG